MNAPTNTLSLPRKRQSTSLEAQSFQGGPSTQYLSAWLPGILAVLAYSKWILCNGEALPKNLWQVGAMSLFHYHYGC